MPIPKNNTPRSRNVGRQPMDWIKLLATGPTTVEALDNADRAAALVGVEVA